MEIIVDQLNNEIENLVENYKDIISQVNCDLRHPKNCRYWMKKSEGCKKFIDCKYLHNDKDKFAKRDKVQVEINSEMTPISLESQSKHRDNFRKKI